MGYAPLALRYTAQLKSIGMIMRVSEWSCEEEKWMSGLRVKLKGFTGFCISSGGFLWGMLGENKWIFFRMDCIEILYLGILTQKKAKAPQEDVSPENPFELDMFVSNGGVNETRTGVSVVVKRFSRRFSGLLRRGSCTWACQDRVIWGQIKRQGGCVCSLLQTLMGARVKAEPCTAAVDVRQEWCYYPHIVRWTIAPNILARWKPVAIFAHIRCHIIPHYLLSV